MTADTIADVSISVAFNEVVHWTADQLWWQVKNPGLIKAHKGGMTSGQRSQHLVAVLWRAHSCEVYSVQMTKMRPIKYYY